MSSNHLSLRTTALRHRVSQTGRSDVAGAWGRIRAAAWSIGQCALAASLGFLLAQHLVGRPSPFFASVAAVVCLGTGRHSG